jgi:hypothetical protein
MNILRMNGITEQEITWYKKQLEAAKMFHMPKKEITRLKDMIEYFEEVNQLLLKTFDK